jgi:hypothetical protein
MINFIEDSVLLAVMLFGVLRRRNVTHLWELLCLQGLFWILAAVITELPAVVGPCSRCYGVSTVNTLHLITQVLVFRNINGESTILGVLGMLLIVSCISTTDEWNMVSDTGYFRFLSLRAFSNRCSNTHIVCPSHSSRWTN